MTCRVDTGIFIMTGVEKTTPTSWEIGLSLCYLQFSLIFIALVNKKYFMQTATFLIGSCPAA
jgi:hypothetical protein